MHAPGRSPPWFVEIGRLGTGKAFKMEEDNERWLEVTRPILAAFFHARFFLEMAVRYTDLDAPPSPLPSGYAALCICSACGSRQDSSPQRSNASLYR